MYDCKDLGGYCFDRITGMSFRNVFCNFLESDPLNYEHQYFSLLVLLPFHIKWFPHYVLVDILYYIKG